MRLVIVFLLFLATVSNAGTANNHFKNRDVAFSMYWGGCNDSAADQTQFMSNSSNCATNETSTETTGQVVGIAGTLTTLSCASRTAPTLDTVWTFQVRTGFTTNVTGAVCSIAAGSTTCSATFSQAVTAATLITVSNVETGTALDGPEHFCTVSGTVP